MKDLEKQIEDAALNYSLKSVNEEAQLYKGISFIKGAKSLEAKEYWQQGMYSEEDLYEILNKFRKEFSLHRGIQIMDFDIKNFIEQNKKNELFLSSKTYNKEL